MIDAELARRFGEKQQLLKHWKTRGLPAARHAAAAKIFGCSIDYIANGTGPKPDANGVLVSGTLDQTVQMPQIDQAPDVGRDEEPPREAAMLEKDMVWSLFSRLSATHRARLLAEMYSLSQADAKPDAEAPRKNAGR